jgi:hypothetical protein
MKIFDAIAKLKRRNHDADPLEVAEWLDDLDGHIYNTLVLGHEGYDKIKKEKYVEGENARTEAVLLAPEPYSEMYIHYLEAQSYYREGDYERYNIAMSFYNAARAEFDRYWITTHSLIQPRVRR